PERGDGMLDFGFEKAESVDAAVAALKADGDAKILAGGQSLVPVLKMEFAEPSMLISLRGIDALKEIKEDGNKIIIGAMATHASVEHSDVVKKSMPSLAHLASGIGDAQVRNRGTIGGSIAHADPAADYPAAIVGYKCQVKTDSRIIDGDQFFTELFETALNPGEVVTAVHCEKPEKAAYLKFANPASKYAIVGVCVAKYSDGVRVGVTGAKSVAFRWTALEQALSANFDSGAAASAELDTSDFMTDLDADAEYRKHLIRVMAKRAIEGAR
ncbi:MAG: FAD binding domain-containing protein, partial [Myxococcota bacterium]